MNDYIVIDGKRLIPLKSAADVAGVREKSLQEALVSGRIPGKQVGGRWYVPVDLLRIYHEPASTRSEEYAEPETGPPPTPTGNERAYDNVGQTPATERIPKLAHARDSPEYSQEQSGKNGILAPVAAVFLFVVITVLGGYTAIQGGVRFGNIPFIASAVAPDLEFSRGNFAPEDSSRVLIAQSVPAPAPAPEPIPPPSPVTPVLPVVERIVERVVVQAPPPTLAQLGGISEDVLAERLNQLENKLTSQIYAISAQGSANSTKIIEHHYAFAQAQKIDNLSGVDISNSTFSGGSITTNSVSTNGLSVTGSATTSFGGGISISGGCLQLPDGTCAGSGSASSGSAGQIPYYEADGSTLTATSSIFLAPTGNVGLGTTTPWRKLSIVDGTASTPQVAVGFDDTNASQFRTDNVGDLHIGASGGDVFLNDDNLWVCTGGSITTGGCPSEAPSGTGNLIVENRLGVGTTSPTEQLATAGLLFVGADDTTTLGVATSTFYGDIKIIGKLDVGTIDPVYTIDGTKYATYGHSTIGIHEEIVFKVKPTRWNPERKMYDFVVDFDSLPIGSDLWLFYQVTDFGKSWENLVVSLTQAFDGRVFYEQDVKGKRLHVFSEKIGLVSVRLIARRYDATKWPNLRPDQDSDYTGHVIESK